MEIEFSGKSFTLTVKLRPLTRKMNAGSVLPSNHFWAHKRAKSRESELDRLQYVGINLTNGEIQARS